MPLKFGKSKTSKEVTQNPELPRKSPSFDYQDSVLDDDDLDEALPSHTRNPHSTLYSDQDPTYQLYHKPSVNRPEAILVLSIIRICVGIVLIVMDALIAKEYPEYAFIGTGIATGLVTIADSVIGMIFLRLQTNCFALVVLNMSMASMCINLFAAMQSIAIVVNYQPSVEKLALFLEERKKQIVIIAFCLLSALLTLGQFILVSCATCTRYKRKQAEKAMMQSD